MDRVFLVGSRKTTAYGVDVTRHLPEQTRRQQILTAARNCFIERGFHPTRMEDIAQEAGLSKGGVYFHFQSKQEVFDSLVKEEFDQSLELIRGVLNREAPVAEKIQSLASFFVDGFTQAPDRPRFFVVMGEMGLRDQELAKRLQEMQRVFIGEIARLLQQGVQEGVLREMDTESVAALLKALIDGVEALHALQYPVDTQRLLSAGLELVLGGLIKTP